MNTDAAPITEVLVDVVDSLLADAEDDSVLTEALGEERIERLQAASERSVATAFELVDALAGEQAFPHVRRNRDGSIYWELRRYRSVVDRGVGAESLLRRYGLEGSI